MNYQKAKSVRLEGIGIISAGDNVYIPDILRAMLGIEDDRPFKRVELEGIAGSYSLNLRIHLTTESATTMVNLTQDSGYTVVWDYKIEK